MTVSRRKKARKQSDRNEDAVVARLRRDVVKSWDHVRHRLEKKDSELLHDEFCIFLEDVPKLIRTVRPSSYFRYVEPVRGTSKDTFYVVGLTNNIMKYSVSSNGRHIEHEIKKFPYPLLSLKHVSDNKIFVGLNMERVLVVIKVVRGTTKIVCEVEQLCSALCITIIPEKEEVVVGGLGFVKVYSLAEATKPVPQYVQHPTSVVSGHEIKMSLRKEERVFDIKVDSYNHKLMVLIESGMIILDYYDWKETYTLSDPEGGTILCCCLDGTHNFLITGSRHGFVKVWSIAIKVMHHQFSGHRDSVTAIACHQHQPVVVTGSADGVVMIWRLDTWRKFKQIQIGQDRVERLDISSNSDPETVGFWCLSEFTLRFYELAEPYRFYASMDSMIIKLQRLLGHYKYPNRIMVATWDGGVWFKNPVTAETVGFMFPMTSLKNVEKFVYNVIEQRLYLVLPSGGVLVLDCSKTPFRALNQLTPAYPDETVTSIIDLPLTIGTDDVSEETVAVLVGMTNGQIDLLETDNLHMHQPIQAHHGSVECMEVLTELVPSELQTCVTSRVLVSVGSDMCVKVWRLRLGVEEGIGFELLYVPVIEIHCDKVPKYMAALEDRVAIVFNASTTVEMYDIGRTALKPKGTFSAPHRVQLIQHDHCLTHTPDYDHTDTVTALDKCPLLKLFATASIDGTVKIWDTSNTLVRELVFEEPVVDVCFMTDAGDLLIARGFILVFSSPEHYLPWSILEKMMTMDFETEKWEMPKEVVDSKRAWIDPDRVEKIRRQRTGAPRRVRTSIPPFQLEEWQLMWPDRRQSAASTPMVVRVKVRKRRGPSSKFDLLTDSPERRKRYPRLSVSMPLVHHCEALTKQWSDSTLTVPSPSDVSKPDQVKCHRSRTPDQSKRKALPVLEEETDEQQLGSGKRKEIVPSRSVRSTEQEHGDPKRTPDNHSEQTHDDDLGFLVGRSQRSRQSSASVMMDDILKAGRLSLARNSVSVDSQRSVKGGFKITVREVKSADPDKKSSKCGDGSLESLSIDQHSSMYSHEQHTAPDHPARFDILKLTAYTPSSSENGEEEEGRITDEVEDSPTKPQGHSKRQHRAESAPVKVGLTLDEQEVLLQNMFQLYCEGGGCGPVQHVKSPSYTPPPSVHSSYADTEELEWHERCMHIPEIPNSIITRTKKHRPPTPLTDDQKLDIKVCELLETMRDDRPPIFHKVIVPRPPPPSPEPKKKKKKKHTQKKKKKKDNCIQWETLEEFAVIRRAMLPVFSTRLQLPERKVLLATEAMSSSSVNTYSSAASGIVSGGRSYQEPRSRCYRAPARNRRVVSDQESTSSSTDVIMHTGMFQCMAEPWFPKKKVERKPLAVYYALIDLLQPDTQVEVLLEVCNYVGTLCREANIPDKAKAYTSSKVMVVVSHENPRIRAACIKLFPDLGPLNRSVLQVLSQSLRSENEELRTEAQNALERFGIKTKEALLNAFKDCKINHANDPGDERVTLAIAVKSMRDKAKGIKSKEEGARVLTRYKRLFSPPRRKNKETNKEHRTPISVMKSPRPQLRMPPDASKESSGATPPMKPFSGTAKATGTRSRQDSSTKEPTGIRVPEGKVEVEDESVPNAPPTSPLSTRSELISGLAHTSQSALAAGQLEQAVEQQRAQEPPPTSSPDQSTPPSEKKPEIQEKPQSGPTSSKTAQSKVSKTVDDLLSSATLFGSDSRSSLHFISTDESDDGELSDSSFVYERPEKTVAKSSSSSGPAKPHTKDSKSAPKKAPTKTVSVPKKSSARPVLESQLPAIPKGPPRPLDYGCYWLPGEPGVRVHHRTEAKHSSRNAPPPTPAGFVKPLDGRFGMTTTSRQTGQSRYGALWLEWTTRVPVIPVCGVVRKLRRLKNQMQLGNSRPILQQDWMDPPAVRRGTEGGGQPAMQTLPFSASVLIACIPGITKAKKDAREGLMTTLTKGN